VAMPCVVLALRHAGIRSAARAEAVDIFLLCLPVAAGDPALIAQLVTDAEVRSAQYVRARDEPVGIRLGGGPHHAHAVALLARDLEADGSTATRRRCSVPGDPELHRAT